MITELRKEIVKSLLVLLFFGKPIRTYISVLSKFSRALQQVTLRFNKFHKNTAISGGQPRLRIKSRPHRRLKSKHSCAKRDQMEQTFAAGSQGVTYTHIYIYYTTVRSLRKLPCLHGQNAIKTSRERR